METLLNLQFVDEKLRLRHSRSFRSSRFSLGSVTELSNHDMMSGSLLAHVHGIQVSYCPADAAGLEYLGYSRG